MNRYARSIFFYLAMAAINIPFLPNIWNVMSFSWCLAFAVNAIIEYFIWEQYK